MIFQPQLAHQILEGRKTQTRRPVKPGDTISRYIAGRTYALERPRPFDQLTMEERRKIDEGRVSRQRYRETIGRLLINEVRSEFLADLTLEDAIAEGFRTRAAFADYWMRLHDRDWPAMTQADCPHCDDEHVIEQACTPCHGTGTVTPIEVLTGPASKPRPCGACEHTGRVWIECPHCELGVITTEAPTSDDEILARYAARHGNRRVWVLTFTLERVERPRFVAQGLGYTSTEALAIKDAGEAVSPDEQKRITEQAGMVTAQWQARERAIRDTELEQLSLGRQLDEIVQEAQAAGVSVSSDVRLIEKRLAALRTRLSERLVA